MLKQDKNIFFISKQIQVLYKANTLNNMIHYSKNDSGNVKMGIIVYQVAQLHKFNVT